MAAEPAFLAALTRMGFSNAARTIITDPERENLRLGDLIHMDEDQVEALCNVVAEFVVVVVNGDIIQTAIKCMEHR